MSYKFKSYKEYKNDNNLIQLSINAFEYIFSGAEFVDAKEHRFKNRLYMENTDSICEISEDIVIIKVLDREERRFRYYLYAILLDSIDLISWVLGHNKDETETYLEINTNNRIEINFWYNENCENKMIIKGCGNHNEYYFHNLPDKNDLFNLSTLWDINVEELNEILNIIKNKYSISGSDLNGYDYYLYGY